MIDPIGDLYQYLSTIPDITDKLDSYTGNPAIFAGAVPPDHDIVAPVIILDYPTVSQRLQTSSTIHRDLETSLRVYAQVQTPSGLDTLPLQQAAETIALSLVTVRISVTGGVL